MRHDMASRQGMRALWGALAFLAVAIVSFGMVVRLLSEASLGTRIPTASAKHVTREAGEGSATRQEWDWEWQKHRDPGLAERPAYLR